MSYKLVALGVALLMVAGCGRTPESGRSSPSTSGPAEDPATTEVTGPGAFAQQVGGLSAQDSALFAEGSRLFTDTWAPAPAETATRDGLGPLFNAPGCSSCHFRNGRAEPKSGGGVQRGLFVRLGRPDSSGGFEADPLLGNQLQDDAIHGVPVEGTLEIRYEQVPDRYDDGTEFSLLRPTYRVLGPGDEPRADQPALSPRITPAVAGVGLLEAVAAQDLLDLQDPNDQDGDGISGRVHLLGENGAGEPVVGRFGWKAGTASLRDQTTRALADDIGITSSGRPAQTCTALQPECRQAPAGGDLEASDAQVDAIAFFTRALAAPARRDAAGARVLQGEQLFDRIGCASCHVSTLRTGASELSALNEQTIHPYTDLLLHDMGPGLASELPEGQASGSEWRTPPLWGIGLVETVNGHTRFLHDGRARNLAEAILWHGGEAVDARDSFVAMDASEREALLAFLESL